MRRSWSFSTPRLIARLLVVATLAGLFLAGLLVAGGAGYAAGLADHPMLRQLEQAPPFATRSAADSGQIQTSPRPNSVSAVTANPSAAQAQTASAPAPVPAAGKSSVPSSGSVSAAASPLAGGPPGLFHGQGQKAAPPKPGAGQKGKKDNRAADGGKTAGKPSK